MIDLLWIFLKMVIALSAQHSDDKIPTLGNTVSFLFSIRLQKKIEVGCGSFILKSIWDAKGRTFTECTSFSWKTAGSTESLIKGKDSYGSKLPELRQARHLFAILTESQKSVFQILYGFYKFIKNNLRLVGVKVFWLGAKNLDNKIYFSVAVKLATFKFEESQSLNFLMFSNSTMLSKSLHCGMLDCI